MNTSLSPSSSCDPQQPSKLQSYTRRSIARFQQDINSTSRLLELELLLLALAIGIQDAISFPDFHCFASNQTGNTVLFAVGALINTSSSSSRGNGEEPVLVTVSTIGVSLGFFVMGVLLTGQAANHFHIAQKRGWWFITNMLQSIIVYIAAAVQWRYDAHVGPDTTLGRVVVGLLAFSAGSQVAVVRGLRITDITTAMATTAYVDLFIDPKIFAKISANRGRNRRVTFLAMMIVGSFVGAGTYLWVGAGLAVLFSGVIKSLVAVMMLFNEGVVDEEENDCVEGV